LKPFKVFKIDICKLLYNLNTLFRGKFGTGGTWEPVNPEKPLTQWNPSRTVDTRKPFYLWNRLAGIWLTGFWLTGIRLADIWLMGIWLTGFWLTGWDWLTGISN